MLVASAYDIYKSGLGITGGEWGTILLGLVISFIVAMIVIKWLIRYVKNHSFTVFGWYRIIFSIFIFIILLFR